MERYSNFNLEAILVHTKYIIILQLLIFSAKDLLNWAPEPNYSVRRYTYLWLQFLHLQLHNSVLSLASTMRLLPFIWSLLVETLRVRLKSSSRNKVTPTTQYRQQQQQQQQHPPPAIIRTTPPTTWNRLPLRH